MFSCEYCEIFKNTYFEKHLRTTASVNSRKAVLQESLASPFLTTQSIMLGFWFILLASIFVTWASWFSGHRFKLEAENFIFHILQINFPNFGVKISVLCSARSLRSFYFSLFCFQLVYTCSNFG